MLDRGHHLALGRPWLTPAIDVHSRCIAGLHLTFEAPSATVGGLCQAHAALDKAAYLRGIGLEADWPCQGRPKEVFVDNGPEFHSDAFKRGCGQHGITLRHRPLAAALLPDAERLALLCTERWWIAHDRAEAVPGRLARRGASS